MLHNFINRQDKAVAVFRLNFLFILKRHIGSHGIFRFNQPAVRPRQFIVVLCLHSGKALIVRSCKTQNGGRKSPIAIIPFIILHQANFIRQFVIIFKF